MNTLTHRLAFCLDFPSCNRGSNPHNPYSHSVVLPLLDSSHAVPSGFYPSHRRSKNSSANLWRHRDFTLLQTCAGDNPRLETENAIDLGTGVRCQSAWQLRYALRADSMANRIHHRRSHGAAGLQNAVGGKGAYLWRSLALAAKVEQVRAAGSFGSRGETSNLVCC